MKFIFLLFLFISILSFGQNRIVLNNDAFIVLENGVKIVVENNSTNGIQILGSGGNITTTSENEEIVWSIGLGTGAYIIPWTTLSLVKMPLTFNITTAGTGTGLVTFSTYLTNSTNTPYPSGVTSMNSGVIGNADASLFAIDRFWGIDATGYTAKPTSTISFSYDPLEIIAPNTISEPILQAQRWNSSTSSWESLLFGSQASSAVSNAIISPTDLYKSWTLVVNSTPLPVELINFDVTLNNSNEVDIQWATFTEINNDYFVIEKSQDGIHYIEVSTVSGAGNSTNTLSYNGLDRSPYIGLSYYRLKQVDFNGDFSYSEIRSVLVDALNELIIFPVPAHNILNIQFSSNQTGNGSISVFDLRGTKIISQSIELSNGNQIITLNTQNLTPGSYYLLIEQAGDIQKHQKFIKQ